MVHKTLALTALLCAPVALFAAAGAIEIKSADQFEKLYNSDKPMVTMYTATWCGPCKATKPHFERLAKSMPELNFCIVYSDKESLIKKANIRGYPTFKFSHKGKPVTFSVNGRSMSSTSGGKRKSELQKLINAFKGKCPKS